MGDADKSTVTEFHFAAMYGVEVGPKIKYRLLPLHRLTDSLKMPRPQQMYWCFLNNILFYLFKEQLVKTTYKLSTK